MKKKILIFLGLVLVCGIGTYCLVPWKTLLEGRVIGMLNERGFKNISFNLKDIGLTHADLADIRIGKENPLVLQSLTLNFSPRELIGGTLEDITLTGLDLQVLQRDKKWIIAGADAFTPKDTADKEKAPLVISDVIQSLPFSAITIKNSHINVQGDSIQTVLPFSAVFTKLPVVSLSVFIQPSDITSGKNTISTGLATIKAAPDIKNTDRWTGQWALDSLSFGEDIPIPTVKGGGEVMFANSVLKVTGDLASEDNNYQASMEGTADLAKPDSSAAKITSASFPFKGGRIAARNVSVKMPLKVTLQVQKISVDELMQTLTGKRVNATGTFSGNLPMTINKDGTYFFGKGALKADTNGLIQMPGDTIPGDNEQVVLVRKILENLHYSMLSAGVTSGKGGKISVQLSLEGNNPEVYNGRIVKLNVNLTGDVLDFIQQNILLFTTPEKILTQGMHE